MNRLQPTTWHMFALTGALTGCLVATASCAQQARPAATRMSAPDDTATTDTSLAAIDPCTGQIVAPTATQRAALARTPAHDADTLVTDAEAQASLTTHPQGLIGKSMQLPSSRRQNVAGAPDADEAAGHHGKPAKAATPPAATSQTVNCVDSPAPVR